MGQFARVAVKAVKLFVSDRIKDISSAWENAVTHIIDDEATTKDKNCPKEAFLGLCEEGNVKGVPSGDYTKSNRNKKYALKALKLLKKDPELAKNKSQLWRMSSESINKHQNNQMDVVVGLWENGLLI